MSRKASLIPTLLWVIVPRETEHRLTCFCMQAIDQHEHILTHYKIVTHWVISGQQWMLIISTAACKFNQMQLSATHSLCAFCIKFPTHSSWIFIRRAHQLWTFIVSSIIWGSWRTITNLEQLTVNCRISNQSHNLIRVKTIIYSGIIHQSRCCHH